MVLPNRAKVSQVNPNRQKAAAAAVEVRKAKDVSKGIGQKLLLLGTTDTSSIHSLCSRAALIHVAMLAICHLPEK